MKKWEITYKNLNIMFGNNVFTKVFEGETAERALIKYSLQTMYILSMISYKEIKK